MNLPREKWNSVVNKTMIYATTNRSIGGVAPSRYIQILLNHKISWDALSNAITTHKIDYNLLNADMFDEFIIDRAKKLLDRIEVATGKSTAGRDAKDTFEAFGAYLTDKA